MCGVLGAGRGEGGRRERRLNVNFFLKFLFYTCYYNAITFPRNISYTYSNNNT